MDDHNPPGGKPRDADDWHPRPSHHRLALHRWEMGQVLHPAQFRTQERALLEHVDLRAQIVGLPSHGVAVLRWNDAQLRTGDLAISELIVVLPSGLLISYPGNAVLTSRNLSLSAKATGPVAIYLRVRKEPRPDDGRDLPDYKADKPEIKRKIYEIDIASEPGLENVQASMKLAELTFDHGTWALGPYVPPLLQLSRGSTPFLRDTLEPLAATMDGFEHELINRAADSVIGIEQLSEVRRMLAAVYRARAVLADHGYGAPTETVAMHPYHLFVALREFYLEAVVLQGKSVGDWPLRYQHDELRACFDQVAHGLDRGLSVPTVVTPRLVFRRTEQRFITPEFPDELRMASDVYLLLECDPNAAEPGGATAPALEDIKLASPRRVAEVYTKALEGVPREPMPAMGFAQTFGHRATVFRLDATSREWRLAVAEGALCFAMQPGLEGLSAALFWQSSTTSHP